MKAGRLLQTFSLLVALHFASAVNAAEIRWQNDCVAMQCDPASLQLTLTPKGGQSLNFHWSATNAATVVDLQQNAGRATWCLVEPQLTVVLQLETNGVLI